MLANGDTFSRAHQCDTFSRAHQCDAFSRAYKRLLDSMTSVSFKFWLVNHAISRCIYQHYYLFVVVLRQWFWKVHWSRITQGPCRYQPMADGATLPLGETIFQFLKICEIENGSVEHKELLRSRDVLSSWVVFPFTPQRGAKLAKDLAVTKSIASVSFVPKGIYILQFKF